MHVANNKSVSVSVWMRGVVSSDTQTQTHVTRDVFSMCVSIYEDMDTWTSSPELQFFCTESLNTESIKNLMENTEFREKGNVFIGGALN